MIDSNYHESSLMDKNLNISKQTFYKDQGALYY